MAFTPSSLGTSADNLKIAQNNLDFSNQQLEKYQTLLETEQDPVLAKQYQEEVTALQQDIAEYQEKVTGYQNLIDSNPNPNANEPSPEVNSDATDATDNPDGETSQTTEDNTQTQSEKDLSSLEIALSDAQSKYDDAVNATIQAKIDLDNAEEALIAAQEGGNEADIQSAQDDYDMAKAAWEEAFDAEQQAKEQLDQAQADYDYAVNAGNEDVTNPSSVDAKTADQNKNPANMDTSKNSGFSLGGVLTNIGAGVKKLFGGGSLNSMPGQVSPAGACFAYEASDLRVKLRVPADYLKGPSAGPGAGLNLVNSPLTNAFSPSSGVGTGALAQVGGILFPYTPQISISNQATYQQNKVMHSNYPFYNYQNSSVGPISITGKFTAQNEYEAAIILAIQHLLRSLTKMKFGDDPDAGAPPPVCRLDAYGDFMYKNVPVAVADWKLELPDQVDYIQVGKGITGYGNTMVPTSCTISLTLNVMYSRQEMMRFNVNSWLSGGLAGKGYI